MKVSVPPVLIFATLPDFDLLNKYGIPKLFYKKVVDKNLTINNYKYILTVEYNIQGEKSDRDGGIPFGIYSRLLLYYICAEIVNKNTQTISFGTSPKEIAKNIRVRESDLTIQTLDELEEQVDRMINSTFTIIIEKENCDKRTILLWEKEQPFKESYKVEVTRDFYNLVMETKDFSMDYDVLCSMQ